MDLQRALNWHFNQLENNIKTVEWFVRLNDREAMTTFRDGGTGWTVTGVLCHLRDFESVLLARVRVTAEQENPTLPFPNPDELAAQNRYDEQDPFEALEAWKARRPDYLAFLRSRSLDEWDRLAQHPVRGPMTMLDQMYLSTMHDTIHLEQMTRILYERKLAP